MKKKIIDIITIFILIVILLINNVKALSSKINLEYEKDNNYIYITVKLEELDSSINAMSAKIEYDSEVLKIDKIYNLNEWSNTYSEETNKITLIKLSGTNQNEEIFKIKFKIEDENNIDDTEICLSNISISDGKEETELQDAIIKIADNNENNKVNNTINNTVNNKVNNTTNNKVNNTANNRVNNTVNNKVNNTTKNKVNNISNNKGNNTVINDNKNIRTNKVVNDSTVKTDIPYAGITSYIRIGLIILLAIGLIVYIKYREINKIV